MPPTRRARNASTPADSRPYACKSPTCRLYVRDLRSLCSRLNLTTTGGCDALIKRIEEARTNTDNLPGTPPPIQDGGDHVENKMIKMPSNCNFSTKSRSYWTGSRHPAHPSTINCSRVTKRGDRESRISRRSSRS